MKKVSIVIPVYNGANYMRDAIDSALGQSYPNCEVIVINDGSTDNGETDRIARSYGDKIRYFSKSNGGVATAVNMGIEKMTGEYFAWLSHDDFFTPDKIEKQMKAIERSGIEQAICHSNFDFLYTESQNRVRVNWLNQYSREMLEDSCFAPVFLAIHGSTLLLHRSHFDRVGLYRTDLRATQDSEFLFRVMRGQKSVFVEDSLMVSRIHPEQGQQTMACHKAEYNKMFLDFCKTLTQEEMTEMCGSVANFYYRLYQLLKNAKPAEEILVYLKEKIQENPEGPDEREEILLELLGDYRNIYIWGAGQYGADMSDLLSCYGIEYRGYLDNDRTKWGQQKKNHPIMEPAMVELTDNDLVIVSMMDSAPVVEQLKKMGVAHCIPCGEIKKKLWRIYPEKIEL